MKHRCPRLLGLLALGIALGSPGAGVAEGRPSLLDGEWVAVQSPNFSAISRLGERRTIELVRELELFRELAFMLTTIESDASPIHNEIILLKRQSDLVRLGVEDREILGLFVPGIRSNLIVMAGSSRDKQHILQHEYVHFLVGLTTGRNYPMWFSEGFAEFMASSRVRNDRMTFGDVPAMRIESLEYGQWVPFRKLLDRSEVLELGRREAAMLYAQSWLLVHYLQLGRSDRSLQADMSTYVGLLEQGVPDIQAFEQGFELRVKSLRKLLVKYAGSRSMRGYSVPIERLDRGIEPKARTIDESEVAVALARAMMHLQGEASEEAYVRRALAATPDSARALATSGVSLGRRGKPGEALSHLEKALEAAPEDPEVVLDMANFWLARAQTEEASEEERTEWLATARRYFVRAWKLDDTKPEVYAMYGRSFLIDGSDPDRALETLGEAARLLPSNLEVRYDLALAHARAGDGMKALELAGSIAASGHGDSTYGAHARDLIREVVATCTPELYSEFGLELHYSIFMSFLDVADAPATGKARIILDLHADGRVRDVEVKSDAGEEFRQLAIQAVHASSPFGSKGSIGFQCFGRRQHKVDLVVDDTAFCGSEEANRYSERIHRSLQSALHTDELLSQPGSGRVHMTFRLSEGGAIERLDVGKHAGTPLGAKAQRAVESIEPFGRRPGAAACWRVPLWFSVDVLGSDALADDG